MKSIKLTVEQCKALAAGLPKYFSGYTFRIAGQTLTEAEVLTNVNTMVTATGGVIEAESAVKDARLAEEKALTQLGPFITELREVIEVAYSNAPSTLAEFLITPRKPRAPLTVAELAAANAKRAATRAARGTKGKKQKAAITGDVTGVNITPITTGVATPAATPSSQATTPTAATPSQTVPGAAASGGETVPTVGTAASHG